MDTSPNAFPIPGLCDHDSFNGLSMRDYFAAKALQGLLADPGEGATEDETHEEWAESIAQAAYTLANAMLAERAK